MGNPGLEKEGCRGAGVPAGMGNPGLENEPWPGADPGSGGIPPGMGNAGFENDPAFGAGVGIENVGIGGDVDEGVLRRTCGAAGMGSRVDPGWGA